MRTWLGVALLVLLCGAAPLFAPQAWAQHGAFPDVAAIAVLYLAISGTPERAAVLGVAIGLVRSAFTPEPLGLDALLYGALGWSGAHFGRAVFEDKVGVRMAAAGIGVVAMRFVGWALAPLASGAADDGLGVGVRMVLLSSLWAALATALASPLVHAALGASRVLGAFERRRRHDV